MKCFLDKAKQLHTSTHSNGLHKCRSGKTNPSMESEYKAPSLAEDLIAVGRDSLSFSQICDP